MAMGPQVRWWVDLEKTRHSKTERVSVSVSDLIYLIELAVLLMGWVKLTTQYLIIAV